MCGIAGFYGFRDDNLIKKLSEQLYHRGPDGEGIYIADKVSLLNRRLAIIDRQGGDQPIYNEDKSIVVSYNGEIYNYRELRKSLETKGHFFKTKSDTEVVVHGYEQWGVSCFDQFNGMFAVSLYDIKKKKLILARDHFGIKPLYYSFFDSSPLKIIFSSEIKPIINSGLIKKKPNDRIIYRYLKYRIHDDGRETFFSGVYRLLPGELMEVNDSKLEVGSYTNLKSILLNSANSDEVRSAKLSKENISEFRQKLIEAIRLRLISEVPVGTCLSGGIDSSVVVSVVNKLLKEKVSEAESVGKIQNTFSAVFPGSANDEEKYIKEVTESIKLKSYKVKPKPEEFFKELEEFVKTQEEPIISTGPYAQYRVMREARKYVTVLLDGQGADEMISGYLPYYFVYLKQLLREGRIGAFLQEFIGSLDVIIDTGINQLVQTIGIKKSVDADSLLDSKFINKFKAEKFVSENDNLKKRLIDDIFYDSLPALLRYEDKNGMRFSLEGRVPYLDLNLLKFVFSLPDEAIIKNGWNKYILRRSTNDLVPKSCTRRRNKIGFTTPEYDWFMRMKNKIYLIFLSDAFRKRKYFNQSEVLKAFQKFIEGKNDETMLFWRLLNVEIWLRVFFNKPVHQVHKVIKFIKKDFGPNEGKKLEINVEGKKYLRFPIRTELIEKGDNLAKKINKSITSPQILSRLNSLSFRTNIYSRPYKKLNSDLLPQDQLKQKVSKNLDSVILNNKENPGWFLVVSEKIVAIAQGRSFFLWEIKAGFWANFLAKFVKRTPYGIGLGSPWTMQLAINEIGLSRILLASLISLITKPLGIRGMFYKIAGKEAAAIDGPTEYSLYPSNVSAKLGPKEPESVAREIHKNIINILKSSPEILSQLNSLSFQAPVYSKSEKKSKAEVPPPQNQLKQQVSKNFGSSFLSNFLGVVVIDANDLGQKVLGNSTGLDNELIEEIFSDNPMGQADEQTPLVLAITT
ncbi:asparagine synthase (glutamine-hydrolyzing) [Candidatus Roizmanbacteria bacterium RIFCSPHIGHO2_12_FULL_36_11]|nr:MAG: asparagine synthase (glutamine-hydrolyzing) [Candidatus Roizmanbacteria bacterium RIFCSPHIGHO2_12_FULL_36_11]